MNTRRIRVDATPFTSVVLASISSLPRLESVLLVLEPQCRAAGAELVVARKRGDGLADLRVRFPAVIFIEDDVHEDAGQLRAAGLRIASGDIVAFADDAGPMPPDWIERLTVHRR